MIKLNFTDVELYNEDTQEFEIVPGGEFNFNYTLRTLYEWENRHNVRFIDNHELTLDHIKDFIVSSCTTDLNIILLSTENINKYINAIQHIPGATVLPKRPNTGKKSILTSDIIYGYMYSLGIDTKWEYENLNKLLLLISVIQDISSPPEKMSKEESMRSMRKQNEEMRRKYERSI